MTFYTVICPFAHGNWQRFFLLQMFASGNGQARRINNALRRPFDKNHYCKIVFACFAKATNSHFPFRRSSLRETSTSATKLETLARKTFCLQTSKKFLCVQKLHTQRFVGQIRFFRVKNLSLLQRRQGTVGTHCDYLNTSARPASFNFSLSLTTVFSSLLGRSAFC